MSSIIAFFMAFLYSFYSFLGIPFDKPDLAYSALDEVTLTAEDKEILEAFSETETAWIASLQLDNGALLFESTQDAQGARIQSFSLSPKGKKLAIITEIGKTEVHELGCNEVLAWDILDVENVRNCDFSGAKLFGNKTFAEQLLLNGAIVDS